MHGSLDPYLYPGSDVLRNLLEIRDPDALATFEAQASWRRILELTQSPIPGRFDTAHLKAIHKHIFQDIFDWAGKFRTVNISKGGHLFASAAYLEPALESVFRKLTKENYLTGLNLDLFARRAGFYFGEINAAHPFREGNGRTQREYIRELGIQAGYRIDWRCTTRDQMIEASRESFLTGNSSKLAAIIWSGAKLL